MSKSCAALSDNVLDRKEELKSSETVVRIPRVQATASICTGAIDAIGINARKSGGPIPHRDRAAADPWWSARRRVAYSAFDVVKAQADPIDNNYRLVRKNSTLPTRHGRVLAERPALALVGFK